MMLRRALAVALALTAVCAIAVTVETVALEKERAALVARAEALTSQIDTSIARGDRIRDLIDTAQDERTTLDGVLAMRPAFIEELSVVRTALQKAEGKIDTAAHLAAVREAQATVRAERDNPSVVGNATATIHALADKVDEEVAAWDVAQLADRATGPLWSNSGAEEYARVRAALNRVGGADVGLYESAACAGGTAPACANSAGYIKYRSDIASWSAARLDWAMAHELAHIHQFRVWNALNSSSGYQSMFGGDAELLANCMALVRGYPGSVGCSGEQQAWAAGIWAGSVQ